MTVAKDQGSRQDGQAQQPPAPHQIPTPRQQLLDDLTVERFATPTPEFHVGRHDHLREIQAVRDTRQAGDSGFDELEAHRHRADADTEAA